MTVSSTTTKNSYSGNGSTTVFAYTFKIFDEDDIAVILRDDATAVETVQTITTNYTVSGVGDAGGGNITFVTAPATGKTVVLLRSTPLSQLTDYTPNDPFPAESHEDALDKLTFITQELSEEIGRAIKLSKTNEIATAEFTVGAAARANKVLGFDGNGDLAVLQEIGIYKGTDTTTTTADYDARDIVKSTTAAQLNNVYIALQDSPSGTLLTNTTYWELLVDAVSAATSATNAANSASAAATSATNAATSETNAATSETNAATSETNAATSATNASNAQTAAETALDTFDDTYLGAKATNPTVDNDGDPLAAGMLYTNTTDGNLYWYDGAAWNDVTAGAGGLADVVDDTTPQLGGNLESNGSDIVMADDDAVIIGTDTDLTILHDSGVNNTLFKSDSLEFKSKANANLTFKISPGATKAATLYYQGSERLAIESGTSRFTGGVTADTATIAGLAYPTSDGTANQVLTTNGTGTLSFQDASGGGSTYTLFEYTATSGQTTFSGADDNAATLAYTAGKIMVVMNGVVLDPSDFTATNGTSVVLSSGAAANDLVNIYAYAAFQVADTVPASTGGEFSAPIGLAGVPIYENAQTITVDYTISNGRNAMSAGPITVNTGVTVTVGTGETWTVV